MQQGEGLVKQVEKRTDNRLEVGTVHVQSEKCVHMFEIVNVNQIFQWRKGTSKLRTQKNRNLESE